MMIHQQPLPPQEPLLHIVKTSDKRFGTADAVHSMLFRRWKKVQRRPEKQGCLQLEKWVVKNVVKMHKGVFCQLSIMLIMHKR